MKVATEIVLDMACDQVKSLVLDEFVKEHPECSMSDLKAVGISMDESIAKAMASVIDEAPSTQTTPSTVTPVQFAQFWLTNPIKILTRGRTLDKVVGRTVVGTWETEQIVATILERSGQPGLYGDFTKAPLANWNVNYVTRDNVRFEMGVELGKLEELRASQARLSASALKHEAMAEAFAILLNNVGWWGFNSDSANFAGTAKRIYGLLNDPNVTAENLGRTSWEAPGGTDVTMSAIVTDIQGMVTDAVTSLQGHYDPETVGATLALPINAYTQLAKINDFGISVRDWLTKTYPKIRVVSCPELVKAISGYDAALFIVDNADGDNVVQQMLTSAMRLVGVQPLAKGLYEVFTCSTAGALVRYPLGYHLYKFAS